MTNQELIRKLQSRIARRSFIMSHYDSEFYNGIHQLQKDQKFDKKLLAALYEAERVKKEYDALWGH